MSSLLQKASIDLKQTRALTNIVQYLVLILQKDEYVILQNDDCLVLQHQSHNQ